jgi:hypothetical protein
MKKQQAEEEKRTRQVTKSSANKTAAAAGPGESTSRDSKHCRNHPNAPLFGEKNVVGIAKIVRPNPF